MGHFKAFAPVLGNVCYCMMICLADEVVVTVCSSMGVVALMRREDEVVPLFTNSDDTDGLRTCEFRHPIEHAHANGNLGRLRVGAACPQAWTRERLEPVHRVLDQRTTVIAALLLPFAPATLFDRVDCLVALSPAGRGRRPVNRAFTRRNRGRCAARKPACRTRHRHRSYQWARRRTCPHFCGRGG